MINNFDCLDPNAWGEFFECKAPPSAVPPCSADVQRTWLVENAAQAQLLTEALNCSGGSFEVEWTGRVVVDEPIFLVNGTVLAITGVGSSAAIDGGGSTRLFTVVDAELHMVGMNVSSGTSVTGGAIAATGSVLTFNRTSFLGNRASGHGGAVYVSNRSNVSCAEGTFVDNGAGKDGGAMFVTGSSTVSCGGSWRSNAAADSGGALKVEGLSKASWGEEALFAYNTAGRYGGALAALDSESISWSAPTDFVSNSAEMGGGAVILSAISNTSWSGVTTYLNNSAGGAGGALFVADRSNVAWTGTTTYTQNVAGDGGGASYVEDSIVSWSGSTSFVSNEAGSLGGGAVDLTDSSLTWSGEASFTDNTALSGGAIQADSSSMSWSGKATLAHNNASGSTGGAMSLLSSSLSWVGETSMFNNSALSNGGAVDLLSSNVSWSGLTTFAYNRASSGGALRLSTKDSFWGNTSEPSALRADGRTKMIGNSAENYGGAVSSFLSEMSWTGHTEFRGNYANFGGAVHIGSSRVSSWSGNTTLAYNRAGFNGGALKISSVYAPSNVSWIGTALFLENSADAFGGAIDVDSARVSWSGNTTLAYNQASYAGAVYLSGRSFGQPFGSLASWGGGTTQFLSNNATSQGGALYVRDSSEVSWTGDTNFVGNSAQGFSPGGALYVDTSNVSWTGRTAFVENLAGSSGAIYLTNGSFVGWTGDTEFMSNVAVTGDGGVVASASVSSFNTRASTLAIHGATTFDNNTCGANGGALALNGGLLLDIGLVNVSFVENVAQVAGGAVFVSGIDVGPVFTGVSFVKNSAQVGGAISAVGSGNSGEDAYWSGRNPTSFYQCLFIDNSAAATGGAIESAAGQDLFDNTLFRGNKARAGGALRLAGQTSLYNCSFVENISDEAEGAAVSNIGSIYTIGRVSFSRNTFDCQPDLFLNFTAVSVDFLFVSIFFLLLALRLLAHERKLVHP